VGGVLFDSLKEARRYLVLVEDQKAGRIHCLRRQRRVRILVKGVHVCTYVADFVYVERGTLIYEDVKSPRTRTLPIYVLKKKLLKAALDIQIRET
jgi:hypothetical protein